MITTSPMTLPRRHPGRPITSTAGFSLSLSGLGRSPSSHSSRRVESLGRGIPLPRTQPGERTRFIQPPPPSNVGDSAFDCVVIAGSHHQPRSSLGLLRETPTAVLGLGAAAGADEHSPAPQIPGLGSLTRHTGYGGNTCGAGGGGLRVRVVGVT